MLKKNWFEVPTRSARPVRRQHTIEAILERIKRAAQAGRQGSARPLSNHRKWFEHPLRRNG